MPSVPMNRPGVVGEGAVRPAAEPPSPIRPDPNLGLALSSVNLSGPTLAPDCGFLIFLT